MSTNELNEKYSDMMKSFVMIQVMGQRSVSFFNKKSMCKELREHLKAFDKDREQLLDFADYFIESCLKSKKYSTTLFGTVPMSEGGTATRIREDIDEVTLTIPARFGMEEEFKTLREAMLETISSKNL